MFGLTEDEMELYKDLAQDFAVRDVAPMIVSNSTFMVPVISNGGKNAPSVQYAKELVTDLETIITLVAAHMAYDYAHLQGETDLDEAEVIQHLHSKYEHYLINQFIKYGLTFSTDATTEIVGGIILELPYLYVAVIEDDDFDDDAFLEEKLSAYNEYLNENFSDIEEDDGDWDEDEEEEIEEDE